MKTVCILLLTISTCVAQVGLRSPAFLASIGNSSFSPTNLTGCNLWLAADHAEFSGFANGQAVTNWTDHSTNALTFFNFTGLRAPYYTNGDINGKPSIYFRCASTNFLCVSNIAPTRLVATNEMTMFFVCRAVPSASTYYIFSWNRYASNKIEVLFYGANGYFYYKPSDEGAYAYKLLPIFTNGSPMLVECSRNVATAYLITNGVVSNTKTSIATNLFEAVTSDAQLGYLTAATGFDGSIAEVIIYNRFLTSNEAVEVRNYLNRKYAIY